MDWYWQPKSKSKTKEVTTLSEDKLRDLFNIEENSFIDKAHRIEFSTAEVRDPAIDSRFNTWVRCARAIGVLDKREK